jgi:hypothetical protein
MENEREVIQWYLTAGIISTPDLFDGLPEPIRRKCFVYGSPAPWPQLPDEAKQAIAARRAAVCAEGERIAAELDRRESDKIKAHLILAQLTAARCDVYSLAGPDNASARAALMTLLTGVKTPQAKSGVTALQAAFYALYRGDSDREKQRNLARYCERVLRSQRDNPALQALADKAQARREADELWQAQYEAENAAKIAAFPSLPASAVRLVSL